MQYPSQTSRKLVPGRHLLSAGRSNSRNGFTLLEIVAVLVILSILAGLAAAKYIRVLHEADEAAEEATISQLQASVDAHWTQLILQGKPPTYPRNPFAALKKLPEHYRLDQTVPSRLKQDRDLWLFLHYVPKTVEKLGITLLQSDNAPAILKNAKGVYKPESVSKISGLIFHQRRNDKVFFWIYDQDRGVISGRYELPKEEP
jgi:prepilin-type N-terminal cleavage/methylation domain-containing protein